MKHRSEMRSSAVPARAKRGSAFLWVFIVMILGALVVTASLVISRQNVRDRVVTLERADGLAYASMAGEIAVAVVRENTGFDGVYPATAPRELSGTLNPYGTPMGYVVNLQGFDSDNRSLRVTVTPANVNGAVRPFVAVARLRPDLTVGDWLVVDYEAEFNNVPPPGLPAFASCAAATPRVVGVGSNPPERYDNLISWAYVNDIIPDRVVVSWQDFRADTPMGVTANTLADASVLSVPVTTPFPAREAGTGFFPPRGVPYVVSMYFEGRLVDSCVVDVTSGRYEFRLVSPPVGTPLCFEGDTATVMWRYNVDAGVRVGALLADSASTGFPLDDSHNVPTAGSKEFILPTRSSSDTFFVIKATAPVFVPERDYPGQSVVVRVETRLNEAPCYLLPPPPAQ